MFQIKVVDKIKTHVLCSETFSRKWCLLWDNVETCGGAREAEDDYGDCSLHAWLVRLHSQKHAPSHQQALTHMRSPTRAHIHTHTHTHKHTEMCNTYCFSTAKMVWRTRLSVTLYVHCVFCLCCPRLSLSRCKPYVWQDVFPLCPISLPVCATLSMWPKKGG